MAKKSKEEGKEFNSGSTRGVNQETGWPSEKYSRRVWDGFLIGRNKKQN